MSLHAEVIETVYNGIKYRSRTEARWAVFFDKLGWSASYETEGYKLPAGWYLPDFYIPEINSFCLVKGESLSYDERIKARQLANHTHKNIVVVIGTPSPVSMKNLLFVRPATPEIEQSVNPNKDGWGWYLGNFTGNSGGEVHFNRLDKGCMFIGERQSECSVIDAFNAARNERFGVHDGKN